MPPAPRKRPVPRRSGLASGELEGRRPAKTPVPRKSAVPRKSGLASGELEGRRPATRAPLKRAAPKALRAAPPRSLTSKGGIQGMTAPQIAALSPAVRRALAARRAAAAQEDAALRRLGRPKRMPSPKAGTLELLAAKESTLFPSFTAKELRRVKNKKER